MSDQFPVLSLKERDRRWGEVRRLLASLGMDCVLVFGLKGREHFEAYLANEHIEGMAILPGESDPVVVTWHPKMIIRRMGSKTDPSRFWIKEARIGKYGPAIVEVLKQRGLERSHVGVVGLEVPEAGCPEGIVPYPMWKAVLEGLPNARFTDISWEFREVMLAKSEEELAVLRRSALLGERACEAMLQAVKPGASEFDIYEAVQSEIHRGGGVSHDPYLIMTWGKDDLGWFEPGWTDYGGSPRLVEPGDLIMAELFPAYGGLETQQQFSIAVAPVEPVIEELAQVAHRCYQAGLAALRPGRTFAELADAMLQPVRDFGGWTFTPMVHSVAPLGWTGGMGYNAEAMPARYKAYTKTFNAGMGGRQHRPLQLRENMSFAFEPNACKGQRRVNVGGSVVVTRGEPEELNQLANFMRVVG